MSLQELRQACTSLSDELLEQFILSIAFDGYRASTERNALETRLCQELVEIGIENFVAHLSNKTVGRIKSGLEIDKASKTETDTDTVENYLKKEQTQANPFRSFDDKLLRLCSKELKMKTDISREDLMLNLHEEVVMLGMETACYLCNVGLLSSLCKHYGLNHAGKKEVLVERILVHIFSLLPSSGVKKEAEEEEEKSEREVKKAEREEKDTETTKEEDKETTKETKAKKETKETKAVAAKPKEDTSLPKELRSIVAGISKDDLSEYRVVDLRVYCKVKGISQAGKKALLVNRIYDHLNENNENEEPSDSNMEL